MKGMGGQREWVHFKVIFLALLFLGASFISQLNEINAEHREGDYVVGNVTLRDNEISVIPDGSNLTEIKIIGTVSYNIDWNPNFNYVLATFQTDLVEWDYLAPPQMICKTPRPRPFTFTIYIPFNNTGGTNKTISIWANWTIHPIGQQGNFTPDNVTVHIKPFYDLALECEDQIKIKAGRSGRIDLNVTNIGNTDDAPDLHILNIAELSERGWKINLSLNKSSYPHGRYQKYPLIIEIPFNERTGNYSIELEMLSWSGKHIGAEPIRTYTIHVEVDGKLYFDLGPRYLVAGSTILFVLIASLVLVLIIRIKIKKG